MKRVQAIVTGKKKQCTKLPKPSPSPKDKKPSSTSETSSSDPPQSSASDKSKENSDILASSATGATSPTSNVITAAGSTIGSSTRGASKVSAPTSSKKGSKDGDSGKSSKKGRLPGSRGAAKSESSSNTPPSGKQKGGKTTKNADQKPDNNGESGSRLDQGSVADDEQGFVKKNRYAEESKESSVDAAVPVNNKSSPSSADALSSHTQIADEKVSKSSEASKVNPEQLSDQNAASSQQISSQNDQITSRNQQSHSRQYPNSILKDSNRTGSELSTTSNGHNAAVHQFNEVDAQQRMQSSSRVLSTKEAPDPYQQPTYGSLPRTSRSATPTAENAYNYGSFPRRSNLSIAAYQNMLYNSPQAWGPLSRKAESDLGFLGSNVERNHANGTYAVSSHNRHIYGTTGYNKDYATIGHGYRDPRSSSGYLSGKDFSDYAISRSGSGPIHYYSDTETMGYRQEKGALSHDMRAGSIPRGYESESGTYGIVGLGQSRFGSAPRNAETSNFIGKVPSSGLRVHPDDVQFRAAPGRRPVPRRHTVGASSNRAEIKDVETERKREAFMQLLAERYPQYADRIQGVGSLPSQPPQSQQLERPSRSRDVQRRRTATGIYHPSQVDYEDLGTMSDLEISTLQRGGFMRTSLPIVRSASTSLERPLGLVFLVHGDQTKKSLLPNEITTLDTVRALFVRAFPDLTMEMLENPRKKIYLFDPAVNMFFQLEDLGEIKDRSVLKIHETNNDQPQRVRERQEIRGRTVQMSMPRSQSRQAYGELPAGHNEGFIKSQSLPPQAARNYQEGSHDQWDMEGKPRSRTPEPADRPPRSLSVGAPTRQRFSHSPDRMPTPERLLLNPIPENRQMLGYRDQGNYHDPASLAAYRGQYPGVYDSIAPYQGYATVPNQHMYAPHSSRPPNLSIVQRTVTPGFDMRDSPGGRHPLNFGSGSAMQPDAGFQRSQSYRIPPADRNGKELSRSHSATPADDTARNRIEKMEQQLANLTAWVHYQKDGTRRETASALRSLGSTTSSSSETFPASSASSLSDIHDDVSNKRSSGMNSRESTPLSAQAEVTAKMAQLKSDLHVLRKQQQLHMEAMKDELVSTFSKIKNVLSSLSETQNQGSFQKRNEAKVIKSIYISDKQEVDKTLSDLEASIEELRNDVISKQCRVSKVDIEDLTLLLSNITKSLASLKVRFLDIHGQMKHVLDDEMKDLASEEIFLKEQPVQIENSQKRCNQVSEKLVQLKRLMLAENPGSSKASQTASPPGVLPEQKEISPASAKNVAPLQVQIEAKEPNVSSEEKVTTKHLQDTFKSGTSLEAAAPAKQQQESKVSMTSEAEEEKVDMRRKREETVQAHISTNTTQVQRAAVNSTTPPLSCMSVPATVTPPASRMSVSATVHTPPPAAVHVSSTTTTSLFVTSTSAASSSVSIKPSFTVASSTTAAYSIVTIKPSINVTTSITKPTEKPTATVSAMTAPVSDTVTTTATRATDNDSDIPVMKNVVIPLTQTTGRLSSTGLGRSESGTIARSESLKKKDTPVYTYQVCGPVNPVFPIPPVFNDTEQITGMSSNNNSPTELKSPSILSDKSILRSSATHSNKPPDLALPKTDSVKKGSVSFSDPPVTYPKGRTDSVTSKSLNGHTDEKTGLATQKQAARSAFFSSLGTVPDSPSSPNRNSASLDQGPVISPTSPEAKTTQSPTITLVLTGTASPKSPTSPGSFTIAPPSDLSVLKSAEGSSSSSSSTATITDSSSPDSQSTDSCSKQKKVPPPPPPRNGSRPTSANMSPANGGPSDTPVQQSQEMPRFVGGILGQHRHSGGPLFSTPKPTLQQKPLFQTNRDNGIYVNLNRQDSQNQNSNQPCLISAGKEDSITAQHSSFAITQDKQDDTNESTRSSGAIIAQQDVTGVVRSSSVSIKDSSKAKPDPPKRHSSLLSKLTGSKDKNKINNGKAKVNGIDF